MDIRTTTEDPTQIRDDLPFVTKQDVAPGEEHLSAYTVEGPDNHVIGIEKNTVLAPELRDSNGDKIDDSAQVILQKADPQGNRLGNAIIFQHNMGAFDYEKMRSDSRFYRTTNKSLLLDEREFLHVIVKIPQTSNGVDASESYLTIGDNATQTAKAVYIRKKDNLTETQANAVNGASSR